MWNNEMLKLIWVHRMRRHVTSLVGDCRGIFKSFAVVIDWPINIRVLLDFLWSGGTN